MSVIVNELTREVKTTEVVGKTYTITLSEQDAALVFYLAGASTYGASVYFDLHPFFSGVNALRHNRVNKPGIDLAWATKQTLDGLSNKVTA